jgi:DNA replication protein DnaC
MQEEESKPHQLLSGFQEKLAGKIDRITRHGSKRHEELIRRNASRAYWQAKEAHAARVRQIWEKRPRYVACTLDNFEIYDEQQNRVLDQAREFLEQLDAPPSCILWGPPGTGKDHILAAFIRQALDDGHHVEWLSGPELFGSVMDEISSNRVNERISYLVHKVDVLAISDPCVGLDALSQAKTLWLYQIVDGRYNLMKPTWISINASSAAEAAHDIGASTVDRLRHDAHVFACEWESYRGRK